MLTDEAFAVYLQPLTPEQAEAITAMRSLLAAHAPEFIEQVDDGKWYGGCLTYTHPAGRFVFALGPRAHGFTTFHMLPFYESAALRDHHGTALKKFLTGKSCIKFKKYADLPEASLIDIIKAGKIASVAGP